MMGGKHEPLELIQSVYKECIGPKGGLFEELEAYGINKFDPHWDYVSGVLYSRTLAEEKREEFREEGSEIIEEEEEFGETQILDPLAKPTTIGLSFNFEATKDSHIDIAISYGIYKKVGKKYKREPRLYILKNIPISKVNTHKIPLKDEGVFCYIKRLKDNISIKIYNEDFSHNKSMNVERCIYQPQIRVFLNDVKLRNNKNVKEKENNNFDNMLVYAINKAGLDKPVKGNICSVLWKEIDFQNTDLIKNKNALNNENLRRIIEDVPFKWIDGEVLLNPQYRKYLYIYDFKNYNFTKININNLKDIKDDLTDDELKDLYQKFKKPDLRTELMPIIPFPLPTLVGNLNINLNPEFLAECDKRDLLDTLRNFRQEYEGWIKKKERVTLSPIEKEILKTHKEALQRIEQAINKIGEDFTVELAFRFANKAIAQSIKWKDENLLQKWNWRPFQIGYILLVLNSIIDSSDRYRDIVDVLWIPTGGGKTEAYLAIIAFTIAWRRLQQIYKWKNFSRPDEPILGDYGTIVLSRYTLRLLSSQQIIRTLKVITAMEFLRSENWVPKPYKNDERFKKEYLWGRQRISLGYLVGGEATPNNMSQALKILKGEESVEYMRPTNAKFITTCPVCETYLAVPDKLEKDEEIRLFFLFENLQDELPIDNINVSECSIEIQGIHDYWENIKSVEVKIKAETSLDLNKVLQNIVQQIKKKTVAKYVSIHPSAPGYIEILWDRNILREDFEIVCPNPECDLNKQKWKELVPNSRGNSIHFEDLRKFCLKNKWIFERIPIPVFFVDEKIFHLLPSAIIATVDKFAQIPLDEESRYSHIFNYVNEAYCGVFDRNKTSKSVFFIPPPNLVLQDELHLIQGTLGSLVGFYETMVAKFLIAKYKTKFNTEMEFTPKYIASSATIKNVEEQVKRIFKYRNSQKPAHFLFPPYPLDLFDDFYVVHKHYYIHPVDMVLQNLKGRIYVGLFVPGRPPAMQTRKVYTPLLLFIKNKRFSNTHPYRTIVGYYNSLKELGIAQSIIIHEVKDTIGQQVYWRELSSNIPSSRIPLILKELESGKNPVDVLFTTSMFGTGVDIPRLSVMVMDGMPKLVADYIQATGRVGRNNTAVVFTLLNPKRVREIVLYEFFPNFHRNLYKFVEHIPVYPFTKKILKKAGGCVLVGLLRNSRGFSPDWKGNNLKRIAKELAQKGKKNSLYMKDLNDAIKIIEKRNAIQGNYGLPSSFNFYNFLVTNTSNGFLKVKDIYRHIGRKSIYFFKRDSKSLNPRVLVTLEQKEILSKNLGRSFCCVYENIPTSLRNVEETFSIILWGKKKCPGSKI